MSEVRERVVRAATSRNADGRDELVLPERAVPAYRLARWLGRSCAYCVVIPVINEGERIGRLLSRMTQLRIAESVDILIVDGGSTDDSLSNRILDSAAVRGLLVKTGPGKLSAQLRCAYAFALEQGYEGIITIDGNDKDDPQSLPEFILALEQGYDFVQASRFIPGAIEEHTPWKRRVAIRWLHAPLISLASGFDWTDTTQGYRGYSRRLLESPDVAPFRECFQDYELLAYLSCRGPQLGLRCIEVPTARRYPRGEAIPTKIGSLRGELRVLWTLLAACGGRFDPDRRQSSPLFAAWGVVACVLLLAIGLRAAVWALHRDFWIDEAMLYAALAQEASLQPWSALGLFEQSSPYLPSLLWKMLIELVGPNELILRLPSLLASIGGLVVLGSVARRSGFGPVGTGATLAMAGLSAVAIFQAAQLKQYSFELLATTLILLTAQRALQGIRLGRLPVSFLGVSILMLPVSYAAPLVTAACALGLLLAVMVPEGPNHSSALVRGRLHTAMLWRLTLLASPWVGIVFLWHHFVVTPSTYFQLSAYPYDQFYLSLTDFATWRHLGMPIASIEPQLGLEAVSKLAVGVIATLWVVGVGVGWRGHLFAHGIAVAAMSLCVVLSLLQLLPLAASRHFLFALPLFALSFGAAMQALFSWLQTRRPVTGRQVAAYSSVLLLVVASGFLRTGEARGEEVRKALVSPQGQRCHTIWPYYSTWPAVLVYGKAVSGATFIGEIDPRSNVDGWTSAMRGNFAEYVRATRELLDEHRQVCLLFSHVREEEQTQLVSAAMSGHVCRTTHVGLGVSLYECRHRAIFEVDP